MLLDSPHYLGESTRQPATVHAVRMRDQSHQPRIEIFAHPSQGFAYLLPLHGTILTNYAYSRTQFTNIFLRGLIYL